MDVWTIGRDLESRLDFDDLRRYGMDHVNLYVEDGSNELHFHGSDWLRNDDDFSLDLFTALIRCASQRMGSQAVAEIRSSFVVDGDEEDCRNYLKHYDTLDVWSDEDLQNHESNLDRLIWLTARAIRKEGRAYFSAY